MKKRTNRWLVIASLCVLGAVTPFIIHEVQAQSHNHHNYKYQDHSYQSWEHQQNIRPVAVQKTRDVLTVAVPYGSFFAEGRQVSYERIDSVEIWDRDTGRKISLDFVEDDGGHLVFLANTKSRSFSAPIINGHYVDTHGLTCASLGTLVPNQGCDFQAFGGYHGSGYSK